MAMVSFPEEEELSDPDFDSNDYFKENDALEFSKPDTGSEKNPRMSKGEDVEL